MKNFIVLVGLACLVFLFGYWAREDYSPPTVATVSLPEISRRADDLPPPLTRTKSERVVYNLETAEVVAELAPGVSYEYWTFNKTVPGPFLRVMEGDVVEINLSHKHGAEGHGHAFNDESMDSSWSMSLTPVAYADAEHGHAAPASTDTKMGADAHSSPGSASDPGHGTHSVDLHSVIGPGGGAVMTQTKPDGNTAFEFKATRPGLYVYHCASPHIPTHVANGMYGMILVEPLGGLSKVDREFYVMQGEFYTKGKLGEVGLQLFDKDKMLAEAPEYFAFNGRVGALRGSGALQAKTGEKIRLFFGVGSHVASNFHVIGGILDNLFQEGDIISEPKKNVQTTIVPPGGSMMAEFTLDVPGTYLLVDHSLTRAVDRGALGELVVTGPERTDIIKKIR